MPTPAGKQKLPKEVMEAHQRERVLNAAIEVFAKRGYPGTTIDHLVDAAKIGVGNFYALFGGKEACFIACYERVVTETRVQIEAAIPAEGDWALKAREALRALLEVLEAEPLRARLALVEVQTAGPKALAAYEGTLESVIPLLAAGRKESPYAKELPQRLEEAIAGGLAWFLQQRIVVGELGSASERLPEAIEIVIEPFVGSKVAAKLAK